MIVVEKAGECIEQQMFYVINQKIANINIKGKPEVQFCATINKNLEAEIIENATGVVSNFYATWYKKANNSWQNVGGGLTLYNISEGMYKVELNGDACVGISSDSITTKLVDDCTILSVLSTDESKTIVTPNPTSDEFIVSSLAKLNKISIYSITGNLMLETSTSSVSISNLASGCYIVKVETDLGTEVHKVVKK